jgi:hypothetical protein
VSSWIIASTFRATSRRGRPSSQSSSPPLLEVLGALGDLRRVGDRVAGDVDVAVDAAVIDAHRGRHREDAILPRADPSYGESMQNTSNAGIGREVHRVPEPEALLVRLRRRSSKSA